MKTLHRFSIVELIQLCIKHIFAIFSGAVLAGLAFYILSAFVIRPQYESKAELYIFNPDNIVRSSGVDAYDLAAAQKMTDTYIAILSGNVVMDQLLQLVESSYDLETLDNMIKLDHSLGEKKLTTQSLLACFTIEKVADTEVLRITATTNSPIFSVQLCQWMIELAIDQIPQIIGKGSVKDVGGASYPLKPSGPDLVENTIVGVVLGGSISVLIVLLTWYFDKTITTKDKLIQRTGAVILGEIPVV